MELEDKFKAGTFVCQFIPNQAPVCLSLDIFEGIRKSFQ